MKIDNLSRYFLRTGNDDTYAIKYKGAGIIALRTLPELRELFEKLSGTVFENGLFKVHNEGSFYLWTNLAFEYFKKYKGNSYCFAFDWVGRQYAVNYYSGKNLILMLDPATAEVFELEANIESFLNDDLDEFKTDLLEIEKFNELNRRYNTPLQFEQCLGFKQFLFLGGKDHIDNYEPIDMEVYWELNHQIYLKTKNLPGGTLIGNISIK